MIRPLRPLQEAGAAAARGYGQTLFCDSVRGGAILLAATAVTAPGAAARAGIACLVATLAARLFQLPRDAWRAGLYGYAGALLGLFWSGLFAATPASDGALLVAAIVAPPLTRLAHRILTPREIPTLALPALALTWAAWPLLDAAPAGAPPSGLAEAIGAALLVLALALRSWLLALGALLGIAVGLLVSLGLVGVPDTGIIANAMPTALALSAVVLPWTAASVALATGAAALAGALAWALGGVVAGLPALVLPFNLVTVATLAVVGRLPALRRLVRLPRPLRLAWLAGPEQSRATEHARRRLAGLVQGAHRICVLTGAGVSTAAGLPDVRGPDGLWLRTRLITLEQFVASAQTRAVYWREEEGFFDLVQRASPAPVHHALAVLGRRGRLTAVVTQNVDGLHQAAGLPGELVVELHGSVHAAVCLDCGEPVPRAALSPAIALGQSPYCASCRGLLKGGGTMFGEPVSAGHLDAALRALLDADLLLVLGTSLLVSPAAEIVRWAREAGVPIAIVNATPTGRDAAAEVVLRDNVNDVLADLVADECRPAAAARVTPLSAA